MREVSKPIRDYVKIEALCKKIKSNENYSFFMPILIDEVEKLNNALENGVEYPYNNLIKIDFMLRNILTWKHIKAADKFNLSESKKELNIHIGRLNTDYDLQI